MEQQGIKQPGLANALVQCCFGTTLEYSRYWNAFDPHDTLSLASTYYLQQINFNKLEVGKDFTDSHLTFFNVQRIKKYVDFHKVSLSLATTICCLFVTQ